MTELASSDAVTLENVVVADFAVVADAAFAVAFAVGKISFAHFGPVSATINCSF